MQFSSTSLRSAVKAVWLGRVSYPEGLELQKALIEKIFQAKTANKPIDNVLLLLEHTPVYTVGIRERLYTDEEERRLRGIGADFCRTNRGGLITFHGPGQLVAYPIVDLATLSVAPTEEFKTRRVGVRRFVHLVEETVIRLLNEKHGLGNAGRSPDTGVWLDEGDRKIAAIGLSIRRGISSHGLAVNCNTDLKWFDEIVPCGIEGKGVTSISKELGEDVTVKENLLPICESFAQIFEVDVDTSLLTGIAAKEAASVI
uniref:Octanoyl-[acyl-carrier-protein]:protein N-octanoyltransferase LIPT2, mitochondrial n=1 Tax=Steinernema glaseri TaxID=37863 RepID=A0A1I7YXT6_9BILA